MSISVDPIILAITLLLIPMGVLFFRKGTPRRAGRWLGVYFVMVGVGFLWDGIAFQWPTVTSASFRPGGPGPAWFWPVERLHTTLVVLDALPLLLFCLEATGTRIRARMAAVYAVPPLFLVALLLGMPGRLQLSNDSPLGLPFALLYFTYYGGGLLLVSLRYAHARLGEDRRRLGFTFVWLGVLVLPRLAYLPDRPWGAARGPIFTSLWFESLTLLGLGMAVAFLVVVRSRHAARVDAWNRGLTMLGMLALVLLSWSTGLFSQDIFAPGFAQYAWRWFLVIFILGFGAWTQGMVAGPSWPGRIVPAAAAATLLFSTVQITARSFANLPDVDLGEAYFLASTLVLMAAAAPILLLWRAPGLMLGGFLNPVDRIRAEKAAGAGPGRVQHLMHRLSVSEATLRGTPTTSRAPSALYVDSVWLGRYEVRGLLGSGAQGRAWRAWDRKRREEVVLKEMLGKPARNEVQALLRVNSPRLPRIYGFEEDGIAAALVMEYVPGPTLRERLEKGRLSTGERKRLLMEGEEALEALHSLNLVHGDVRAENLIVHPDRGLVLVDLGLTGAGGGDVTAVLGQGDSQEDDLRRLGEAVFEGAKSATLESGNSQGAC